ncbi:MAG TPA: NADPH:quinone reductase [Actinopolymorphaceae bacterium]
MVSELLTTTAAYIDAPGPPEAIRVGELPLERPGPREVLVLTDTVVVDPVDTYIRSGSYRTSLPRPYIIGRDLVGTVVATGAEVDVPAAGDRVWCNSMGIDGRQGTFATFVVVPAERLFPLPPDVDPVTAVAALHPATTAVLGLLTHAALAPGETVFVGGGAGNVGTAMTQVAAAHGAEVIVSAREEDAAWCRRAGARAVVDYREPEFAERLTAQVPDGVDVYVDTSGRIDLDLAVSLLRPRGRIVLMSGTAQRPELPVGPLYTKHGRIIGFAIGHATVAELSEAARVVTAGLTRSAPLPSGWMVRIHDVLPLTKAAYAHRLVEQSVRGRVVLRTEDT